MSGTTGKGCVTFSDLSLDWSADPHEQKSWFQMELFPGLQAFSPKGFLSRVGKRLHSQTIKISPAKYNTGYIVIPKRR